MTRVASPILDREAKDRAALDPQTANALAKRRKDLENRDRQFHQWDGITASDLFGDYLASRLLRIEQAYPELPYDETAEVAVIGAICIEGATAEIAIGPLHPNHFKLKYAMDALCAIAVLRREHRKGNPVPIDACTIGSQMRRMKTFVAPDRGELGTADFLVYCMEQCPNAENISAYIDAVMNASRLRFQHWLGLAYARETLKAEAEPAQLLSAMRGALDTIELRGFVDLNTVFEITK
ncbi:hypothetical protein EON83_12440 [bacterium]|nr:MAG: hypothetical protein EON83_12440 [bacterium]